MTVPPISAAVSQENSGKFTLIATFCDLRQAQIEDDLQRRQRRFDAELARRMDLLHAGKPLPREPIADNPYTGRRSGAWGVVIPHPAVAQHA